MHLRPLLFNKKKELIVEFCEFLFHPHTWDTPSWNAETTHIYVEPKGFYCLSKKSWPILYSKLLYKLGQDFLGIQYLVRLKHFLSKM